MKTCPFCAESIQDEAIICRYCGNKVVSFPESLQEEKREPSVLLSLLLAVLILALTFGVGWIITANWSGSYSSLEETLLLTQFVINISIAGLALYGLSTVKGRVLVFLGVLIMTYLPILGWIVLYWAGKGIARKLAN